MFHLSCYPDLLLDPCPIQSSMVCPMVSMEDKRKYTVAPKPLFVSKCFIDACQPFEWKPEWYPVARSSPELRARILKKYDSILKELL